MKKKWEIVLLLGLLCSLIPMPSATGATEKLKLSDTSVIMGVDDRYAIFLEDDDYEAKKAKWFTSDKTVVELEKDKKMVILIAKKLGTASVIAEYKGKKYTCKVDVKEPGIFYSYNKKKKTATVTGNWGKHKTLWIPSEVKGYTVTRIGTDAFCEERSLERVILPSTVTELGMGSFAYCTNLTSVQFPLQLKKISDDAFFYCKKLKNVVLPVSVTTIGEQAFQGCSGMKKLKLPVGIKNIGREAFSDCTSLKRLTIPNDFVKLGESTFYDCKKLKQITIPESYQGIDGSTFDGTKWLKERRKESPFVIVNGVLIDTVNCKGDVVIPEGVTKIASYAIYYNREIISLTLPDTVKKIDHEAILECNKLKKLVIENPNIQIYWDSTDFGKYNKKITIYASQDSMGQRYAQIRQIPYKNFEGKN